MSAKMYFCNLEMKSIVKFIIAVVFIYCVADAKGQQIIVKGYVMSIDSSKVIPLANILNKSSNQRFISSRMGLFKLKAILTDTITITAIGYENLLLNIKDIAPENSDDTIQVYMRPTAYQLKDVTFVYNNSKRDSIAQAAADFLKSDPLMNNYDRVLNRAKGGVMSPLTAMWNEYSKAGQDMKHFEEFMRHAEMLKQVSVRYNKRAIKRATALDDKYLDAYIIYCKLDKTFVLSSSDYELILAMRQCAEKFKIANNID